MLRDGDILRVEKAGEKSFGGALGETGSANALSELLAELDPRNECTVNTTAFFKEFYSTHLAVGDVPLAQMNQIARLTYQQEVNPPGKNFVFDYERVGLSKNLPVTKVNLHAFSVEESRKKTLCDLLGQSGRVPSSMMPRLFACRNVLIAQKITGPEALLILHDDELLVGVVHQKKIIFSRAIQSGQNTFLEQLSRKLEQPVSLEMLERALSATSTPETRELDEEIRDVFQQITDTLYRQIERSFQYYSGRLKLPPVEAIKIYINSDIAGESLAAQLQPQYDFPVLPLRADQAVDTSNAPDCSTLAAGAALAAFIPCPSLLYTHDDQLKKKRAYRIQTGLISVLGALALICAVAFFVQLVRMAPRMSRQQSLQRQIEAYPPHLTREILETKTALIQKETNRLRKLAAHHSMQGYFYEITRLLPENGKLENAEFRLYDPSETSDDTDGIGELTLRGFLVGNNLEQQAVLTKFLVQLEHAAVFKNIERADVSASERETYKELGLLPFKISCKLMFGDTTAQPDGETE